MVVVTLSHSPPLYTGINLTLTCTMTVNLNVDLCEMVMMEWSGHQDIPEERYSILCATYTASGPHVTYTGSLTISPLAYQDTATYTCTGTVIGFMSFHHVTTSDNIRINVKSKLYSHTTHFINSHTFVFI